MNPSLVRLMIGEPCLTQSRVHFKSKLVAVPAGFWTGQARSRTAPSVVIVFALGSILVPWRASTGPRSDMLIAVARTAWNKVELFISLLWLRDFQSGRNLHHIERRKQLLAPYAGILPLHQAGLYSGVSGLGPIHCGPPHRKLKGNQSFDTF